MTKYLTTKEVAEREGVVEQRVRAKLKQKTKHYPHAKKCPCGQAWLIPEKDLKKKHNGST